MDFETIKYEQRGAVAWIRLNRPDEMNSLSPQLVEEFAEALAASEADPGVRALAITGAPPAFCAGADLKFMGTKVDADFGKSLETFLDRLFVVTTALENSPLPTIAAVNGLALAGGLELVLCCDLVYAAQSAKLGDAHANYGLLPGAGSSIRLPRKIGPTRAKYMLFTGDFIAASELVDCGLVNEVVADDELESTVQKLAERLAANSPLATRRVKQLVADAFDQQLPSALRQEIAAGVVHTQSEDMREGLAAFNAKRKPKFTGK